MSDTPNNPVLQFDRAEFETTAPAPACRQCARTISGSYYEINGQPFCPECRGQIEESVHVDIGVWGVVRAAGAGVGAGIVGALLYYGVLALSGYEFALIAIVVGYLVGRAAIVAAFLLTREGLLVILAVLAAVQAWHADESAPGDTTVLSQFVGLIAVLAWMCTLTAGKI